ncbi:MAG: hypothetical protein HPY57_13485 [Ignavibacteria bacterium]|nr:hypothetical protein [Ignavibacteria bacterium]
MPMLRNSTLNQLKRINDEIKKQGGVTDRRSDSEKDCAKVLWIHDPIDADKSGKRKIATIDQMIKIDIPDAPTKVKMKNEMLIMNFEKFNEKDEFIKMCENFEKSVNEYNEDVLQDLSKNFQKIASKLVKNNKEHEYFRETLNDIQIVLKNHDIIFNEIIDRLEKLENNLVNLVKLNNLKTK